VDFFKNFLVRTSLKVDNKYRLRLCNEGGGYMIQSHSAFSCLGLSYRSRCGSAFYINL